MTPEQSFFRLLTLADIGDEGNRMPAVLAGDLVKTDFNWKARSVLPSSQQIQIGAHRGHFCGKLWRQQLPDSLAYQCSSRPAKHLFERTIRRQNDTVRVHG